jgi:carbon monoxide dehydrogenase subunit G
VELTHVFTVPTSPAETWEHFGDIASVAECFPGAAVTSAEGDDFEGTVKVKLGPIALLYAGSGQFVQRDEAARTFVIEARGKDKRGNGTAAATVTATMAEAGSGTEISVVTDLHITGKPAQFGRGVMQDVSDKLLGQFVTCLEQRVAVTPPEEEPAAVEGGAEKPAEAPAPEPAPEPTAAAPPPPVAQGEIDLGTTVLPVLVKNYWRQALAGIAVLAVAVVVIRWVRGR